MGLRKLLLHIQSTYAPKGGILITENGCAVDEPTVAAAKSDTFRVRFYQMYLSQVHRAIAAGADVRAYFAWSMMDNFEWSHGYTKRFGIGHVDYVTQVRTPKASAKVLSTVWRTNQLEISSDIATAALVGEPETTTASQ
jgi:beta-glucosidase